jgi:pimeloyl-ACP methyl ester carboxylesterase
MAARLYSEQILGGTRSPTRWLAIAHGIFGSGANWRSIARKLVERRPEWGVSLLDLRGHGRSEHGDPPHDLAACAADVHIKMLELTRAGSSVEAIAGHSFGGKVALQLRSAAPQRLRQTWVIDASPSARPNALADPANGVARVLATLDKLPKQWKRRDDFTTALVDAGCDAGVASLLAMNLARDTLTLQFDLVALRAMLADYYARDVWRAIEEPGLPGEVEVVLASRGDAVPEPDRARYAAADANVHVHRVDGGHWLNADAPAALVELFASRLPA